MSELEEKGIWEQTKEENPPPKKPYQEPVFRFERVLRDDGFGVRQSSGYKFPVQNSTGTVPDYVLFDPIDAERSGGVEASSLTIIAFHSFSRPKSETS